MEKYRLRIPEGCAAIPLSADQKEAALKVSLVVKAPAGRNAGSLVRLRSTLDSEVFLACLADASGQILAWLELWLQSTAVLRNTLLAQRVFLSNAVLDDRWHRRVQAFDQLGTAEKVTTGWETSPPLPTFLDVGAMSPVHPKDEQTGAYWQLCRDEGILQSHGLPPYAGSLHRYLYLPDLGSETPLVPVTEEAPTNDRTRPLAEICPNHAKLIPFNPAAGLLLVTKHYAMDLEGFLDLLGGADLHPESSRPAHVIDVHPDPGRDGGAIHYPGRLFFEAQGKYSRLIEVFHLKLVLLSNLVASVHAVVRCVQQPLLNLSSESFQVEVDRSPGPLPFLWTACPRLVEPGHALAMHVGATDLTYYASPLLGETSVYRPAVTSLAAGGRALVRIRKTPSESRTTATVEGTLATQERLELGESDLVILQLPLASGPLSLCAHAKRDSALAADEYRFRTLSRSLDDGQIEAIRSAQGVPLPGVPYEVIQPLSSPCDLYSLAIVAIRTLLVGRGTSLPIAVDEMLSLARQVQAGPDPAEPLPVCVERVFRSDPRWLQSVGPHHLTEEEIAPEDALSLVPPDLWWSALAMIVRMFPGLGPASSCRDYGDARAGGLHLVFERTLSDLSELILKTRYLVTPDLKSDRQIAAVIRRYLGSQTEQDSDTANTHRHPK
jgi:hypothetical protein